MTTKHLPDPRLYPNASVSNRLIHQAQSVLGAVDDDVRELERVALGDAMDDLLARDEVLLISVALNMAPSRAAYQVLWQALRQAVEAAPGRHAEIFALPLVLVAGSKSRATLPDRIADVDGLNAILRQHGVFAAGAEVFLSGRLLHPDAVVGISPGQLYRYTRQLADAARGLPLDLEGSAVTVQEEGVFLRYLVGVAIRETTPPVDYSPRIGAWGTVLMKFLGEALQTEGVTLFPIFRAPAPLMQALVAGNQARLEVAQQVFVSSLLRKLRSEGKEPVVALSAHHGGEIHVAVSSADAPDRDERFVWPLAPLDRVERIEEDFLQLMRDCQVEMVRIEETVQPAQS
ncbi:hypothetical protein [Paludibacterium purpuratum]|uniref:Uncharacterized protein n=1 Tax=Paludibacterium purpuratum TaxID=1144873 RepID=A0A4R7B2D5_9NEIS|nr:hypothetical protein [Paludibacterium purpuratum]TDR77902.1 hypothetical protein DFP86_109149 [Paludibacterium purpuratum]